MSQQFCYTSTPNVEEETFRLLVLFDYKIDIADWNTAEAQLITQLTAAEVNVALLEATIDELYKMFLRLRCDLRSLGI
jgi:hypothetical protein